MRLPPKPTIDQLRRVLGAQKERLLVFDDVLASFGGWGHGTTATLGGGNGAVTLGGGGSAAAAELTAFHEDAQALLSSWCCTDDAKFKRLAGVIPYVLPPLEGQKVWRGTPKLTWASSALAEVFDGAGEAARAAEIRPPPEATA